MASHTFDLTSIVSATGWTGATVANLTTSNDVRATGGTAGEIINAEITNVPGAFGSANSVVLSAEWRLSGTATRAKNLLIELTDAAGTTVHATFTTPSVTTQATDRTDSSTALTGVVGLTSTQLNAARLRVTVQEGGGMADAVTVEIDRLWATLDYAVATQQINVGQAAETDSAFAAAKTKAKAVGLAAETVSTPFAKIGAPAYGYFDVISALGHLSASTNAALEQADGKFSVRLHIALDDWEDGGQIRLFQAAGTAITDGGWWVILDANGRLAIQYRESTGTATRTFIDTAAPVRADGKEYHLRVDLNTDNGSSQRQADFYQREDMGRELESSVGWTFLSTITQAGADAGILTGQSVAELPTSNQSTINTGHYYRVIIMDLAGSTIEEDLDLRNPGYRLDTDTFQKPGFAELTAANTETTDWAYVEPAAFADQAFETDTAFATAESKVVPVGLASETDTALTPAHTRTEPVGQASETDTAFGITIPGELLFGNEGFEGTGYEETWNQGESGAGTVNEDQATSGVTGAVARMQASCLQVSVTGGQNAQVGHDFGSDQPITYARGDLIWVSESGETGLGGCSVVTANDSSALHTWSVRVDETTEGSYRFTFAEQSDGTFTLHNGPSMLLGTAYLWEVQWDTVNDEWEFRLDESTVVSGTMTASARAFRTLTVGVTGTAPSRPHTIVHDNIAVGDTDWLGPFSTGQNISVGQASETDAAQAIAATRAEPVGQAAEADAAFAITVEQGVDIDVGQAAEADAAFSIASARTEVVGQVAETDTAFSIGVQQGNDVPVGQVSETDAALALASSKTEPVGQASETDAGLALTATRAEPAAQALETDTALAMATTKAETVGQASENNTAGAVASTKVEALGQASEADTAQALTAAKSEPVNQASEADTAQAITTAKAVPVGQATELDTGQPIGVQQGSDIPVALTAETDTAFVLASSKTVVLGLASETSTALATTVTLTVTVDLAVESDQAFAITTSAQTAMIGLAEETDLALAIESEGGPPGPPVGRSWGYPVRAHGRTREGFAKVR